MNVLKTGTSLDIAFFVAGMPFNADTLKTASLGGSETAGIYLARSLSRIGHRVLMFCNGGDGSTDDAGVRFMPLGMYQQYAQQTPHDVSIVQRVPAPFTQRLASRMNILWMHDLALGRSVAPTKGVMWNVDKMALLSDFMVEQYKSVLGVEDSVVFRTTNGVDLDLVNDVHRRYREVPRDRQRFVYAARPERGLDILLEKIAPKLFERLPTAQIVLAGYNHRPQEMAQFYSYCDEMRKRFGPRIVDAGHLSKADLYKLYHECGAYIYPTPSPVMKNFYEVSCISAMEAQACGLPIITSKRGALPETIHPDAGVLLEGDPQSDDYVTSFVQACVDYASDETKHTFASIAGRRHAIARFDWDEVASRWDEMFTRYFSEVNSDPDRLARHFIRQSDAIAAWEVAKRAPDLVTKEVKDELESKYNFYHDDATLKAHYENIVRETTAEGLMSNQRTPRYQHVLKVARELRPKRLLDYGCDVGHFTLPLAKALPETLCVGVDIGEKVIQQARDFIPKLHPGGRNLWYFSASTEGDGGDGMKKVGERGPYDMALICEVLEHVKEPWKLAQKIEREHVERGGRVYISVPFGPWEYSSYDGYPWRCHIWHFDAHDLRDMFAHKPGFRIDAISAHMGSRELGDALGWWVVQYEADFSEIPPVDMERKLRVQSPRQTISANIIAGPNSEEYVLWCLRSLRHITDEIVVGDCGLSDLARQMIQTERNVRIIPSVNPREKGFEAARNIVLAASRMDWVLWIDTDERLINSININKYARESMFHGFALKQHHFSVDTSFPPDMPVRLFRRRPYKGKTMRFHGAIHEHPELNINGGPGPAVVMTDVHIAHVGYLVEGTRRERFVRNYPLMQMDSERNPTRLLNKHFQMRDKMQLVRYELANNNGVITEPMREVCKEIVSMYREHFLGKGSYLGADSIQYYSDALMVLGEGFEVDWSFEAAKDEVKQQGAPQKIRFANVADMQTELAKRMNDKAAAFESEFY